MHRNQKVAEFLFDLDQKRGHERDVLLETRTKPLWVKSGHSVMFDACPLYPVPISNHCTGGGHR